MTLSINSTGLRVAAALAMAILCSLTAHAQVNRTIGTLPPGGTVTITFDVTINTNFPNGLFAVTNQGTVIRSFFTNVTDDPAVGGASDPTVTGLPPDLDYGDAPNPYPTLAISNGARHVVPFTGGATLFLGAVPPDVDTNGQPNATATGDNITGVNDEGGVALPPVFRVLQTTNITVTASAPGKLDAWVDWNADGDWNDVGEQIFTNLSVAAGANSLTVNAPNFAASGTTFARFRLSSAGSLLTTGQAADGEVEDYQVSIDATKADLAIFKTDAPDPLVSSNGLAYTLTVTNIGINLASSVTVTDVLPASVTFVSASPGVTQQAGIVYYGPFALASGGTTSLTVQVAVGGVTPLILTNRAHVRDATATDTNLANNAAIATTTLTDVDADGLPNFADPDNDNDGIPDFWETQYGLNPTNAANASLDPDLDGYTTLQEFLADTVPTNGVSFPRFVALTNGAPFAIVFPSSTARLYRLEYATNLLTPSWIPLVSNVPGQSGTTTLLDTNGAPSRTYRFGVGLP